MSNVVAFPGAPESAAEPLPAVDDGELAVTTNLTFLRGASHPEDLVRQAAALGLAGIGIADRNSVAGVVQAYAAVEQLNEKIRELNETHQANAPELKLAVGARLTFADGTPDILAYPQNRSAWGRLTRLLTVGKSRAEKAECILFIDDLIEHIAGLNLIVMPSPSAHSRASGNPGPHARYPSLALDPRFRGDDDEVVARLSFPHCRSAKQCSIGKESRTWLPRARLVEGWSCSRTRSLPTVTTQSRRLPT